MSLKTTSPDHESIHNGQVFQATSIYADVASDATIAYGFKTPTIDDGVIVHLKPRDIFGTANRIRVDFYEGLTVAPVGTDVLIYNRNRNSDKTSKMQAFKSATSFDVTNAVIIEYNFFVTNNRPMDREYILKPNTWYLVTMTNQTGASADISMTEYWIEE